VVQQCKGIWLSGARGWKADVFAHYSSIQREGYKSLKEGDVVQFDIIQGEKGPQADRVVPIERGEGDEAL
jgi:CspA family cold shock protein